MGSNFREQLKDAAKDLGIESSNQITTTETKIEKPKTEDREIKIGDLVYYTPKNSRRFSIFRMPGGNLNKDLSITPRMGYKDKDAGFTVESFQEDDMVEIKPIKYSYRNDEGKTYLVNIKDVTLPPENRLSF